jgi:hypothetical protein
MAKAKKKRLPNDFEALLKTGSLKKLKLLFDTYDVNARTAGVKQTSLAFPECPDELTRWLVEQGADLSAEDHYGDTPLHSRSRHWKPSIEVLLQLGADVNYGENARGTPLHAAAGSHRLEAAALLLRYGARVDALNREGQTPLAYALDRCPNSEIQPMAALAELLLAAGVEQTQEMLTSVTRIGTNFEFHRAGFNRGSVQATSEALDKLYALFGVPPVPRRILYDGKSPIVARSATWEDQHQELWELLVPSRGAASTVQGEIIRISGRIHIELEENGGINWDPSFKKLADAYLVLLASGTPLAEPLLTEAHEIVPKVKRKNGDTRRLCELAVSWVALNRKPLKLPPVDYDR